MKLPIPMSPVSSQSRYAWNLNAPLRRCRLRLYREDAPDEGNNAEDYAE